MRAALLACLLIGCYSPQIKDGQFLCADGKTCPSGFVCKCGGCYRPEASCTDGGLPTDGGGMDGGGDMAMGGKHDDGCASLMGHRAPNDLNLADLAVCNAAWAVPGLATTQTMTPCNHMVGPDGKTGSGTSCTAADNCAAGWHICKTEAEMMAKGLTAPLCAGLSGFFATTQGGSVPMSGGMPSGPPQCTNPVDQLIFGCGSMGMPADACTIVNRVLVDNPGTAGTDECSTLSSGGFLCTGAMMGTPETSVVTKPMLNSGGGLLCCRN